MQTHKRAFGGCKSAFGISSAEWGNADSAVFFNVREATHYGAAVPTTIKAVDKQMVCTHTPSAIGSMYHFPWASRINTSHTAYFASV